MTLQLSILTKRMPYNVKLLREGIIEKELDLEALDEEGVD